MRKKILFSLIVISLHSCGEFLKPNSPNEYVPETIEALAEILIGEIYMAPNSPDNLFSLNEFLSDNVSTINNSYALFGETAIAEINKIKKIYCFNPNMFNPFVDDIGVSETEAWEDHYVRIRSCNAILDYIETVISNDEDLKNRLYAETYFFRAFYYFNFVNIFGEPYIHNPNAKGVPIKLSSSFNPDRMERNSVKEVYDQIIIDLDIAEEYYSKFADGKYFSAVTKPSIHLLYLLRSRVELYMGNWRKAKNYAEKVINSGLKFALFDLNSMIDDPIDPEKPLPYPSYTSIKDINSETIFAYGNADNYMEHTSGWVTIPKYTGINTSEDDLRLEYFIASPDLMNSFAIDDLRKRYYSVEEFTNNKGIKGPIRDFYKPIGKISISKTHGFEGGNDNFGYSFRLSEAYLNYAEASAQLGEDGEARDKLSMMMSKRYLTGSANATVPASLNGTNLIDFILIERRKEFCFEGHRWFDQRRTGMRSFDKLWYEEGDLVHTIRIFDNDPAFTVSLTNTVLVNNKKLVQNASWAKKY